MENFTHQSYNTYNAIGIYQVEPLQYHTADFVYVFVHHHYKKIIVTGVFFMKAFLLYNHTCNLKFIELLDTVNQASLLLCDNIHT